MTAYVSTCPNCGVDIDIPETTGWSPVDETEDFGDGGWSRPVICTACEKEYLVQWKGHLPNVIRETFYHVVDMSKGRYKTIRLRFLLGRVPNAPDAPSGLGPRQIQRMYAKGNYPEKIRDRAISACAVQAGIPMDLAERLAQMQTDPA